jgi:hypothetical protein
MALIFAIAAFIGGYVFAMTRRSWQDWGRVSRNKRLLGNQRWSHLRSTVIVTAVLLGLLYIYVAGKG